MKSKNYETTLPEGYKEAMHINAKDLKVGIIMNLIALIPIVIFMVAAVLLMLLPSYEADTEFDYGGIIIFGILYIVYIVLHELTHGAAYKILTRQKLTFGLTLTVAFCGVPHIYTYRKAALIAICAPFAIFNVVFGALTAVMYFSNTWLYIISALLFSVHFGGCIGDLWLMLLLNTKFKDNDTLMRDTGPEQFIYVKE